MVRKGGAVLRAVRRPQRAFDQRRQMPGQRQRLLAVVDGSGVGVQVRAVAERDVQPLGEQRLVEAFVHAGRVAQRADTLALIVVSAAE